MPRFPEHNKFLRSAISGTEDSHLLCLPNAEMHAGDEMNLATTVHVNSFLRQGTRSTLKQHGRPPHQSRRSPVDGASDAAGLSMAHRPVGQPTEDTGTT
jgi:hypothetical protein